MNIRNTTTGVIEQLRYDFNGCDHLPDIIGNSGSLVVRNRETGQYEGPAEEIAFWRAWVSESEAADALEQELADYLEDQRAAGAVSEEAVNGAEINDQPSVRSNALRRALMEQRQP